MTDTQVKTPGEPKADRAATSPVVLPTDFFLTQIVDLSNLSGITQGVVLNVEGVVISGNIIPGKEYFRLSAEQMRDAAQYNSNPEVINQIAELYDSYQAIYDPPAEGEEPRNTTPGYIHLKDVKYMSGGNITDMTGALWRGRIAAVSGFSIGLLNRN